MRPRVSSLFIQTTTSTAVSHRTTPSPPYDASLAFMSPTAAHRPCTSPLFWRSTHSCAAIFIARGSQLQRGRRLPGLKRLRASVAAKAASFRDIIKIGISFRSALSPFVNVWIDVCRADPHAGCRPHDSAAGVFSVHYPGKC